MNSDKNKLLSAKKNEKPGRSNRKTKSICASCGRQAWVTMHIHVDSLGFEDRKTRCTEGRSYCPRCCRNRRFLQKLFDGLDARLNELEKLCPPD